MSPNVKLCWIRYRWVPTNGTCTDGNTFAGILQRNLRTIVNIVLIYVHFGKISDFSQVVGGRVSFRGRPAPNAHWSRRYSYIASAGRLRWPLATRTQQHAL